MRSLRRGSNRQESIRYCERLNCVGICAEVQMPAEIEGRLKVSSRKRAPWKGIYQTWTI